MASSTPGPLESDFAWFREHQDELVEKYEGQFLIIKDRAVVGALGTYEAAFREATERFKLGTFLIQQASPGESAYSQTFHSRVA